MNSHQPPTAVTLTEVCGHLPHDGGGAGWPTLTARQLEVAVLLRRGLRHAEIAALLDVSPRQVARLASQARQRANAATTSHLAALLATSGHHTTGALETAA